VCLADGDHVGVLRPLFLVALLWIGLQSAGSLALGGYLLRLTGGLRRA
jgi:hypothetical protein